MDSDLGEERVVRKGTATYKRALGALFAIGVGAYALVYAPQPLLRVIGDAYEVTAAQSALIMSATTFSLALFVLFWGAMTTRISERTIIIGALAVAIIISVAIPFAPNWTILIALRAVQGVALAGPLTATLAWVGRHVEAPSIAQVSGLYIAGTTVGGMAGRLLSGFANELTDDWRMGIASVSIMSVILGGIAHVLLPRTKGKKQRVTRAPRPDSSWQRRQRFVAYGFALVGMGMFVGIFNVLVYRVAEPPWNLGTAVTSMFFLSYLTGTLSSARAGDLVKRLGQRGLMIVGTITMAIGVALTIPTSLVTLWLGLFILCAGFFGMHALSSGRASGMHPRPGTGSGLYLMFYYIGSSVGGIVFGFGWDIGQWPMVLIMAASSLIVILVLSLFVSNVEPSSPDAKME